jgi:hypothetical protein
LKGLKFSQTCINFFFKNSKDSKSVLIFSFASVAVKLLTIW